MNSIRILISESHDPYFNLAVEDAIFQNMADTRQILFLWRNADTVVIGKGQNPWKECNTARLEADGVKLARRKSGGGAVFHDLGNTNFTFMGTKPDFDKSISTQIVLDALSRLGVSGKATGRNDLVVEVDGLDRKFSGSAYRDLKDRAFHHGTLLLHADLGRLANYLNPDKKKLQAKGVASVRSRVANLREVVAKIDHESVCEAIQTQFTQHFEQHATPEIISPNALPDLPGFEAIHAQQQDWNWNFGRALAFSHLLEKRFKWGGVDLHLDVKNGLVKEAKVFTDCLFPEPLELIAECLVNRRYDATEIASAFESAKHEYPGHADELNQVASWLRTSLR